MSRFDVDVPFSVPFVHRLRFTSDVFGLTGKSSESDTLAELLEPGETGTTKVQFWLDEDVANALPQLKSRIRQFVDQHDHLVMPGNIQLVPGGEACKNDIHIIERMLKCMNAADLDRRSYVIVIGGGAVLDAVGFAAAIAHRGIRLVRFPTTTLAQADSGVGVKNAVNLFAKKNWIGTFATPWAVLNDTALLSTLPDRDFVCGFSEAVKVTAIKDADAFGRLEANASKIAARDEQAVHEAIVESARLHLDHITLGGDPFEALEARPLDYGHWLAHKLEVMADFDIRHGEAVGIGVAIDTVYSSMVHGLPEADADRIVSTLMALGMPLDHPKLDDVDELFAGLEEFRQHLGGRLTVTMLPALGQKVDVHEIDETAMREAIMQVREMSLESRI